MVNYRRNRVNGGTYFFTVTLRNRSSKLLIEHVQILYAAMRLVKNEMPYKILGFVILPEHLHAIFELPPDDDNYSERWRRIKNYFTREVKKRGIKLKKDNRGEYNLWQRRFWEHTIRDEKDLENHLNYIHYNPVKHQHVACVKNWPYSSFHYYVAKGWLSADWGGTEEDDNNEDFGE